jgi:hypothetical protein
MLDPANFECIELDQQFCELATPLDCGAVALSLFSRQTPGDPLSALTVSPLDVGTVELWGLAVTAAVLFAAPSHALDESTGQDRFVVGQQVDQSLAGSGDPLIITSAHWFSGEKIHRFISVTV